MKSDLQSINLFMIDKCAVFRDIFENPRVMLIDKYVKLATTYYSIMLRRFWKFQVDVLARVKSKHIASCLMYKGEESNLLCKQRSTLLLETH